MRSHADEKGFTLIELLAAMVILSVLISVGFKKGRNDFQRIRTEHAGSRYRGTEYPEIIDVVSGQTECFGIRRR